MASVTLPRLCRICSLIWRWLSTWARMALRLETNARHCLTKITIRIMNMMTNTKVTEAPMKPAAALVRAIVYSSTEEEGEEEEGGALSSQRSKGIGPEGEHITQTIAKLVILLQDSPSCQVHSFSRVLTSLVQI